MRVVQLTEAEWQRLRTLLRNLLETDGQEHALYWLGHQFLEESQRSKAEVSELWSAARKIDDAGRSR